jgi:hypothetical protein
MILMATVLIAACANLFVATAGVAQTTEGEVLGTVRITASAMAGGTPLPAGTYQIRLTNDRPAVPAGQSPDGQRWVEFVAAGKVVAREIAEILRDDNLPAIGASSRPVRAGIRVDMLKGGEFLRVSIKRAGERFLIYLTVKS